MHKSQVYVAYSSEFSKSSVATLVGLLGSHEGLGHYNFFGYDNSEISSYDRISLSPFVVAEVSHVSMGVGIELGWADAIGKTIFAFYRSDVDIPQSVTHLRNVKLIPYSAVSEIPELLSQSVYTVK